jgi:hypothetical protein
MLCRKARKRLIDFNWQPDAISRDLELVEHLGKCRECQSLLAAEQAVTSDLESLRSESPIDELAFARVKSATEKATAISGIVNSYDYILNWLFFKKRFQISIGVAAIIVGFMALVPFNFREKAGYEIAIAGVDKCIAEDNTEIGSLFSALGMEKDKTSELRDSLDVNEIRLNVGECRETCYLTISDLKSEKDVAFVVKKIIELGCCQIDKIVPIFRNESSSLLKHITKKLLS